MSHYVKFTKEGLLSWEGDSDANPPHAIDPGAILRELRVACQVDGNVTLGDIFRIVDGFPKLVEFIADYSWCPVAEFHREALLPRPLSDPDNLAFLEIGKYVDIDEFGVESFVDFIAVAPGNAEGSTRYSVSSTPMNEIAHLPLRLNPTIEVRKDYELVFTRESFYTLLDVLDAIYNDISFFGGPRGNSEFNEMLKEAADDVRTATSRQDNQ